MTRPPPTSPLFPSTTPFRSPRIRHRLLPQLDGRLERVADRRAAEDEELVDAVDRFAHERVVARRRCRDLEDRKSTRLNSSHANIRYDVFRLKKQPKTYNQSI